VSPIVDSVASEKRTRKGVTATELMGQLNADPEYQRRKAKFEAELQQRAEAWRRAEQPIVKDLRRAGHDVISVWDLVNTATPYPDALPVLLEHLEAGGYPDRVMESLGRALAVKPSVVWWDRLKVLYLNARNPGEETGTAVALAACATKAQLDDLIGFLSVEERGESRIFFLRPIKRVGDQAGREVLVALRDDRTLGKEATALLRVRRKR
jgi:hypothetical protein